MADHPGGASSADRADAADGDKCSQAAFAGMPRHSGLMKLTGNSPDLSRNKALTKRGFFTISLHSDNINKTISVHNYFINQIDLLIECIFPL